MPAYAYKINVVREPVLVNYYRDVELHDTTLTLAILRQHVKENETFTIERYDGGDYYNLEISGKRMETQEEADARIKREDLYNHNQEIYQERQRELREKYANKQK